MSMYHFDPKQPVKEGDWVAITTSWSAYRGAVGLVTKVVDKTPQVENKAKKLLMYEVQLRKFDLAETRTVLFRQQELLPLDKVSVYQLTASYTK